MLVESDFMVNPFIVMNNGDRDEWIKEWTRRCNFDNVRELSLHKERRRRELKKSRSAIKNGLNSIFGAKP